MKTKGITIDGRRFIAKLDDSGNVRLIYERVTYAKGKPWAADFNQTRWHAGHHPIPCRKTSIYRRVIDALQETSSDHAVP